MQTPKIIFVRSTNENEQQNIIFSPENRSEPRSVLATYRHIISKKMLLICYQYAMLQKNITHFVGSDNEKDTKCYILGARFRRTSEKDVPTVFVLLSIHSVECCYVKLTSI
jgi:hypothetical protein